MEVKKIIEKRTLTAKIKGEVNAITSVELEATLKTDINKVDKLILDLEECNYVSSAGLRVFLAARKFFNHEGAMSIINVSPEVMEVLEFTGFTKILEIKTK